MLGVHLCIHPPSLLLFLYIMPPLLMFSICFPIYLPDLYLCHVPILCLSICLFLHQYSAAYFHPTSPDFSPSNLYSYPYLPNLPELWFVFSLHLPPWHNPQSQKLHCFPILAAFSCIRQESSMKGFLSSVELGGALPFNALNLSCKALLSCHLLMLR